MLTYLHHNFRNYTYTLR